MTINKLIRQLKALKIEHKLDGDTTEIITEGCDCNGKVGECKLSSYDNNKVIVITRE
jgi:hypothetical protein